MLTDAGPRLMFIKQASRKRGRIYSLLKHNDLFNKLVF